MIKINKNSIHARYYLWLCQHYDHYINREGETNICHYIQLLLWGTIGLIAFFPFTIIGYVTRPIFLIFQAEYETKNYTSNGGLAAFTILLLSSILDFIYITANLIRVLPFPFTEAQLKHALQLIVDGNAILGLGYIVGLFCVTVPTVIGLCILLFKTCKKVQIK